MNEKKSKLKKNDFIEIEYIGKVKDGDVFDTNIEEQAKKVNIDIKTKPMLICLGQNMILPSIDEFLIGKEIGTYTLELAPEKAFGKRDRKLVKTMPLSVFSKHKINPERGMVFTFDNMFGKVLSTGSRVIVDFNNPIAGKDVVYELNIKKIVTEQNEKIKSLMLAFFRKEFQFEVKENKLEVKLKKEDIQMKPFVEMFKPKFKEILNLEIEIKEKE